MLIQLPGVLSPDEIRQARALLEAAEWPSGRASAGSQALLAKHNEQLPHDHEAARALRPLVLRALDRQTAFFAATLPKRVYPPAFNRYTGTHNRYGNHVDGAVRYHPETGQRIRTDLSCTLFLSDPDAYDGGELVIRLADGERRIRLAAGGLVCYPATTVHEVTPVTRGVRLASFFWIESLVRSAEQRQLLADMDQALVALRRDHGESDATIALTGTYHHLLRLWADA